MNERGYFNFRLLKKIFIFSFSRVFFLRRRLSGISEILGTSGISLKRIFSQERNPIFDVNIINGSVYLLDFRNRLRFSILFLRTFSLPRVFFSVIPTLQVPQITFSHPRVRYFPRLSARSYDASDPKALEHSRNYCLFN